MGIAERMSGVDRAWLLMDRPANPMIIVALAILGRPLALPALRELLSERFTRHLRFRCVPLLDESGARWAEVEQFDLDDHLQGIALPVDAGQSELEQLVGRLASAPLNPARPRWCFHLLERFGEGSALILRVHHAYADGAALLRVFMELCEGHDAAMAGLRTPVPGAAIAEGFEGASVTAGILQKAVDWLGMGVHYALHPSEGGSAVENAAGLAAEMARVGLMSDDPPTPLKRALSGVKRVAWSAALPLEELHTIASVLGCTVNDILISILSGALGHTLRARLDVAEPLRLRAVVPVNLRSGSNGTLGNDFGLVFVPLPVGMRHPLERLYSVHSNMQQLKGSAQALLTFGLLSAVGNLPAAAEEAAIGLFSAKASVVASNLPGPRAPLTIAGAPVTQLMFWVPQTGDIGIGVSMLSYCGQVRLGVMADRGAMATPHELVSAMAAEFERLVLLVLLGGLALSA